MNAPNITTQVVEKAGIVALLAALCTRYKWFVILLGLWVLVLLLDWLTGSAAAMKNGEWSSKVAREGAWHKAGELAVVFLSFCLDVTIWVAVEFIPEISVNLEWRLIVTPLVLAWYILTEAGSIIENAGKLGAPIPEWLKKLIATFRSKVDKKGDKAAETSTEESKNPQEKE